MSARHHAHSRRISATVKSQKLAGLQKQALSWHGQHASRLPESPAAQARPFEQLRINNHYAAMIIATGIDIVEIQRLENVIEKHGRSFLERFCAPEELAAAPASGPSRREFFAGRWAVKEAVAKALGTGIGAACAMTDILVLNNAAGKPELTLRGEARKTAASQGIARIHISISHERDFAVAHAIAESGN